MMPAFAHGQTTASKCMWLGQTIAGLTAVEVRKYLERHQITDVMICRYPGSFTLLHIAAGNSEDPDVIDVLIASGADPFAEDHRGRTPIYMAVDNNNITAIKRLFLYDASHLHVGHKGQSALTYCQEALKYYPTNKPCIALHRSAELA